MTVPASKDVLRWARNARGLSQRDTAKLLGIREQELVDIEDGRQHPTSAVFDKMIGVYKQPESLLLLEHPPTTDPLPKDYRTAAGKQSQLSPDTRLAIREAQELQRYVSELLEEDPQLIDRIELPSTSLSNSAEVQAKKERERIGVPLEVQLRWRPGDESFNRWRDWLERKGLLVLLKKMPWEDCRGFSLMDGNLLPTIVVNSEDVSAARIFTLFHEYAHLTLRNAGICKLTPGSSNVEQWCNTFAAAFLLPGEELTEHVTARNTAAGPEYDWSIAQIGRLAGYYRVSRAVMALRLQKLALAIPNYFEKHKGQLTSFDQRVRPTKAPKIVRRSGWKEKQKLREVGITAASVIVDAWKEQIADATEAADILNLSLDELHGLQVQTEVQRVRNVG